MTLKRIGIYLLAAMMTLTGCGSTMQKESNEQESNTTAINLQTATWDEIEAVAKGSTVTYYGWGGDDKVNAWMDKVVAKELKDTYDITFKRVGMDITDILTKLLSEKETNATGTIDIVWLNGENFFTAKSQDLLYGVFTDKLPSFNAYINHEDVATKYDFGVDTEGMEAPWGKAQFVFFADKSKVGNIPQNAEELLAWIKENPGKFTYPAVPEFTGSAFIRNMILQLVDKEALMNGELSKEEVEKVVQPGIDYLKEMQPYLWREGSTYPTNFAQLSNMYADGEVYMGMTYTADGVDKLVKEGSYPEATEVFTLEQGGLSNTHYLTIPKNTSNAAGAMVVINALLSPKLQASKLDASNWGDLTVLDRDTLEGEEKALFDTYPVIDYKTLAEPHAKLIPVIEKIWEEQFVK